MKAKSIRDYLLLSWLAPLVLAILGSAFLSLAISYIDYSNYRASVHQRLHQDGAILARRVAAELLLKDQGRTSAVIQSLKSEYSFTEVVISNGLSPKKDKTSSVLTVQELIPGVSPNTYVEISTPGKHFRTFLSFRNSLLALIPIFGLVLSGFLIQRYLLRRYILRPIQALAETSVGKRPVRDYWPVEIQKIAIDLTESFSSREQAVFGQLARGLIHDIRTYIHSVNTALQLVKECTSQSDRQPRLEKLESACSRNIPKVRELLDLSLDSSREIVLKPMASDISQTLRHSVQNIQDLADAKGVSIVAPSMDSMMVSHDRLQLERVFTNLIKNAVEAAEGSVCDKRCVEITAEGFPGGLRVQIEDSGPGFVDYRQAFRPLKTTKTHGYGLGLFVSRKIVQAHRGALDATVSERLGGAQVTVTLPKEEFGA